MSRRRRCAHIDGRPSHELGFPRLLLLKGLAIIRRRAEYHTCILLDIWRLPRPQLVGQWTLVQLS